MCIRDRLSSTQHLANPKNAWRSFVRFRSSWLSREAVFAILGYPLFALTIWAMIQAWPPLVVTVLLVMSVLLILVLVYCTAMIYASLKTIPQWNTKWVPLNFLIFAVLSGVLCLGVTVDWRHPWLVIVSLVLLFIGFAAKLLYFRAIGQPTRSSINTATSFSQAQVTLFDAGHSSKNFSQREFIYEVGPKTARLARILALAFSFILPALLIGWGGGGAAGIAAVVCLYLGLLLERWLFFVEAKHVVRHYYEG